jgi:hypothetical protein
MEDGRTACSATSKRLRDHRGAVRCRLVVAPQHSTVVAYSVSQHWTALLIFGTIPTLIGVKTHRRE